MRRIASAVLSACLAVTPCWAIEVVTDTPVVHSLTASVMGETGTPVLLLDRGADPHAFQLRPSQARALAQADMVFWVGEELTPWLARTLTGEAVALLHVPEVKVRSYEDEGDHGHAHGHDHDHASLDPHAWLDPANAQIWLRVIADELGARDPENAESYQANARAEIERIDAMVTNMLGTLAPMRQKPIMTFHDAYGYLAQAFEVDIAGSVTLGDAATPGARHLREIQSAMIDGDIACIFREPQHDASITETIANDAGISLGTLDPSGSTLEPGPGLYRSLMTKMSAEIARCVASS